MKKLLWVFALAFSLSMFSNGVPPSLSNFRIEKGQTSKVYFDSNKSITASSTKGFTISGKKISGITINSGKTTGHYFKVSQPFTFWDNNTIRYKGGSNLKDKNNSLLSDFTLEYIANKLPEPDSSKYRYVSLKGNDKNDGTSASKAWRTIDKAASTATSGMTVWIKAGNYGNERVVFDKNGTALRPIKFIGYKSKIGDINSMYYKYGSGKLQTSKMPTLSGNNSANSFGLYIKSKDYIMIKNIQVRGYDVGFNNRSNKGILIDNCVFKDNIGHNFGGYGISMVKGIKGNENTYRVTNWRIKNTIVLNSANNNMFIVGEKNLIENCESYCNVGPTLDRATDYYITIKGGNSIVRNSHVERAGTHIAHTGHGIGVKTNVTSSADNNKSVHSYYNLFEKNYSKGVRRALYVRNNQVRYNVFKDSEIVGFGNVKNTYGGGIELFGSPRFNVFERIYIHDTDVSIAFYNNREGERRNKEIRGNIIRNCIIKNTYYALKFDSNDTNPVSIIDNKIINCTFNKTNTLVKVVDSPKLYKISNNQMINCVFNDVNNLGDKVSKIKMKNIFSIDYSNFYSGFKKPVWATNSLSVNPQFKDISKGNFKLKSTSKLIDAGKNLSEVKKDFDGNARSQGISSDIGAFEYGDNTTATVNSDTDKDTKVTNPPPANANAGDDISICLGESITLNGAGGNTYKWNTGDTNKDIIINPTRTTTYELTATRGGVTNTDTVTVTVENCNIISLVEDDLDKGFVVYPSPTNGILNISVNNNSDKEELNLTLTSINGSIVYSDIMNSKQSEISKQIDLSRFAKGIYFVRLFNSNQNMVKKVLVI